MGTCLTPISGSDLAPESGRWILVHDGATNSRQWGCKTFHDASGTIRQYDSSLLDENNSSSGSNYNCLSITYHVKQIFSSITNTDVEARVRKLIPYYWTGSAPRYGENLELLRLSDTTDANINANQDYWNYLALQNALDCCQREGIRLDLSPGLHFITKSLKIGKANFYTKANPTLGSDTGAELVNLSNGFEFKGLGRQSSGNGESTEIRLVRDRRNRFLFYWFGSKTGGSFRMSVILRGKYRGEIGSAKSEWMDLDIPYSGSNLDFPANVSAATLQTQLQAILGTNVTVSAAASGVFEITLPNKITLPGGAAPYTGSFVSDCHGEIYVTRSAGSNENHPVMLSDSGVVCYFPTCAYMQKIANMALTSKAADGVSTASYGLCYATSVMSSAYARDITVRYCHTGVAILKGTGGNGEFAQFERVVCMWDGDKKLRDETTGNILSGTFGRGLERGFLCTNGQAYNIQFNQCQWYIAYNGTVFDFGSPKGGPGYGCTVNGCNISFDDEQKLTSAELEDSSHQPKIALAPLEAESRHNIDPAEPDRVAGQSIFLAVDEPQSTFEFIGGRVEHMDTLVYYTGGTSTTPPAAITFRGVEFQAVQCDHIFPFIEASKVQYNNPFGSANLRIVLDNCSVQPEKFWSRNPERALAIFKIQGFVDDGVEIEFRGGYIGFSRRWIENAGVHFNNVTFGGTVIDLRQSTVANDGDAYGRYGRNVPNYRVDYSTSKARVMGGWSPSYDDPSWMSYGPPENLLRWHDASDNGNTTKAWITSSGSSLTYKKWDSSTSPARHTIAPYGGTLTAIPSNGSLYQRIRNRLNHPEDSLLLNNREVVLSYEGLFLLAPGQRLSAELRLHYVNSSDDGGNIPFDTSLLLDRWDMTVPSSVGNTTNLDWESGLRQVEDQLVRIRLSMASLLMRAEAAGANYVENPEVRVVLRNGSSSSSIDLRVIRQWLWSGRTPKSFIDTGSQALPAHSQFKLARQWHESASIGGELAIPQRPDGFSYPPDPDLAYIRRDQTYRELDTGRLISFTGEGAREPIDKQLDSTYYVNESGPWSFNLRPGRAAFLIYFSNNSDTTTRVLNLYIPDWRIADYVGSEVILSHNHDAGAPGRSVQIRLWTRSKSGAETIRVSNTYPSDYHYRFLLMPSTANQVKLVGIDGTGIVTEFGWKPTD